MGASDRVVLITGATGGLGRVAARVFGDDGARLVLNGTNGDRLRALASELDLADDAWTPLVVDLRNGDAARAALIATEQRLGRVDVVLHLVGGWSGGTPIAELDPGEVSRMLQQHVWTTLHMAQAIVPGMVERGWGRVIAVSAPVASEPIPKMAPYAIAKAGEEVLLRTLAREVANTGVTVNLVVVRAIDVRGERSSDPKKASWTTPEEIAATLRYLASDDASAVNGARIPLYGR